MIDESHRRLLLQRDHVDLKRPQDIELWTSVLEIYAADLLNAVAEVGTSSTSVLRYIVDNGLVGRTLRAPAVKPPGSGTNSANDEKPEK